MNASAFVKVDKATFFTFVERQGEGRYEYVRGRIMQQQQGGTRRHARIADALHQHLRMQLDAAEWVVLEARGIETDDTVRYPDVVVEPASEPDHSLTTRKPIVIVEVLSPSSSDRDLDVKPAEYLAIATLQAYIVASQDEPACYLWVRDAEGAFPAAPVSLIGREKSIDIPVLSLSIPLDAVYAGIRL